MSVINISSTDLSIPYQGNDVSLSARFYIRRPFVTSTGAIASSGPVGGEDFYLDVPCLLSNGIVTIPAFSIDSTSNAVGGVDTYYVVVLCNSTGDQILYLASHFKVPSNAANISWSDVINYTLTGTLPTGTSGGGGTGVPLVGNAVVLGNSYTIIPAPNTGTLLGKWWGTWGMAASDKPNDFVHLTQAALRAGSSPDATLFPNYCRTWEVGYGPDFDYEGYFGPMLDEPATPPTHIIFEMGDNVTYTSPFDAACVDLLTFARARHSTAVLIVLSTMWNDDPRVNTAWQAACTAVGATYIQCYDLFVDANLPHEGDMVNGDDGIMRPLTSDAGILRHYGDPGHLGIFNKLMNILQPTVTSDLLLDVVNEATVAAYSLRKLRDAYTGNAIRVRRVSDGEERNIGFDGNDLNWTLAAAFKGASSLKTVAIYDQGDTVSPLNATQSDTTKQPTLNTTLQKITTAAGEYLETAAFDASALTTPDVFAVIAVLSYLGTPNLLFNIGSSTQGAMAFANTDPGIGVEQKDGPSYSYKALSTSSTAFRLFFAAYLRSGVTALRVDNADVASGGASGSLGDYPATSKITIGGNTGGVTPNPIDFRELVIYSTGLTTDERDDGTSNINTAWEVY